MSRRGRRSAAGLAAAAALLLGGAAPAEAQLGLAPSCNPASISGTALDGQTLTASRGSCTGVPSPTVTLRWFRCDAQLANCVARTGQAQAATLAVGVTPADVNSRLVVQQVATNLLGTDLDNTATGIVAAIPPSASPVVFGIARVGEVLSGSEGFLGGTSPTVTARQWLRCAADGGACAPILGATTAFYKLTSGDAGSTIRFRVTVQGPQEAVDQDSAPTAVVATAGEGGGVGGGGGGGGGGGAPGTGTPRPGTPTKAKLLRPFPTVVIAGRVFRIGAVVETLVVRGPKGAQVRVSCRGRTCPVRAQRLRIRRGSVRLRRFETGLAAGTLIEIRVTKGTRIGKFTRLRIRRGSAPARTDLCLTPGRSRPARCPAGVG